jgi:hypothetical protein
MGRSQKAVGGGTGMICHEFKGRTGTASRVVEEHGVRYIVGALVQSNCGRRESLRVDGVPVGQEIGPEIAPTHDSGSMGLRKNGEVVPSSLCWQLTHHFSRCSANVSRAGRQPDWPGSVVSETTAAATYSLPSQQRTISGRTIDSRPSACWRPPP